ncbi:DinB family protein [Rathayibacter soli]|uniref:DinB family protein n=1 Tax=Rathayibacter soli TaxID=3144168 RepID=UPI0027E43B7B|nr:DinB family protein [Glaciibacter superstes]
MVEKDSREIAVLQHFLDAQRSSVLAIVDGLDDEQLATQVLPSGWTPLGMIEHLADAEQHWFQDVACGAVSEYAWPDVDDDPCDPDAPFTTHHSAVAVLDYYRRQCELSNEILAATPLGAALKGTHNQEWEGEDISDLRWVALHMIEETARHAGHLDAARELLDGTVGLGPR